MPFYRGTRYPLLTAGSLGGAAFSPLSQAPLLWLDTQPPHLFQTTDESTPATANNDPVGRSNDRSGNGYHCLQSTAGERPLYQTTGGLLLDGTDDNLEIPDALLVAIDGIDAITVALRFKGTVFESAIRLQTGSGGYIILGFGAGTPEFAISTDGGVGSGVAIAGVEDDEWHHVAGVWQRNTVNGFQVYVDGVVSAQKNAADVALPSYGVSAPAGIGAYLGGGPPSELTTGTIDQIVIVDRALSADEVAELAVWEG